MAAAYSNPADAPPRESIKLAHAGSGRHQGCAGIRRRRERSSNALGPECLSDAVVKAAGRSPFAGRCAHRKSARTFQMAVARNVAGLEHGAMRDALASGKPWRDYRSKVDSIRSRPWWFWIRCFKVREARHIDGSTIHSPGKPFRLPCLTTEKWLRMGSKV